MLRSPNSRVVRASGRFRELDGAILEWWTLAASHGQLELTATGLARGTAVLGFMSAEYVDCPTTMHHVRLRMASPEETDLLRQRLAPEEAAEVEREDHLVIECDEGHGWIYAGVMGIDWVSEPDRRLLELLEGPLWDGGPPLSEL